MHIHMVRTYAHTYVCISKSSFFDSSYERRELCVLLDFTHSLTGYVRVCV